MTKHLHYLIVVLLRFYKEDNHRTLASLSCYVKTVIQIRVPDNKFQCRPILYVNKMFKPEVGVVDWRKGHKCWTLRQYVWWWKCNKRGGGVQQSVRDPLLDIHADLVLCSSLLKVPLNYVLSATNNQKAEFRNTVKSKNFTSSYLNNIIIKHDLGFLVVISSIRHLCTVLIIFICQIAPLLCLLVLPMKTVKVKSNRPANLKNYIKHLI